MLCRPPPLKLCRIISLQKRARQGVPTAFKLGIVQNPVAHPPVFSITCAMPILQPFCLHGLPFSWGGWEGGISLTAYPNSVSLNSALSAAGACPNRVGGTSHAACFPYFVTSLRPYFFFLSDRATSPPCHGAFSRFAAAPPSSRHPRRQNSQPRSPLPRRAAAFPSDCCTLRKFSTRRLSQICTRPLAQTVSRARIQDVLQRPPSHRVPPRSPCATHPAVQFSFHSRASVRPPRAARRHTSQLLFQSSRFSLPEGHSRNSRTTPHPSTRDKHFFAARQRSRLRGFPRRESRLQDTPCRRKLPSGCASSSRCESCRLFVRDIHSRALRPSPSARCPRRKYVLPCWGRENPRDSRSRTPRDAALFPARRSRWHPRASDDTRAAIHRSELPRPDPAAAAFSCGRCAPASSLGRRGA